MKVRIVSHKVTFIVEADNPIEVKQAIAWIEQGFYAVEKEEIE